MKTWTRNFVVEKPRKRLKSLGYEDYNVCYLHTPNLKVGEEPPKALMICIGSEFYYYKLIKTEAEV